MNHYIVDVVSGINVLLLFLLIIRIISLIVIASSEDYVSRMTSKDPNYDRTKDYNKNQCILWVLGILIILMPSKETALLLIS